ncbi:hypothetical protein CPB86DRAFT_261128 [Serendipita vermifera]|nr:hypothetical protein CPB86DRAFT_261128 [Serendipita vermifera]
MQHPIPKFQQLCLHHLPVEVIRLVYREANLRDARLLSSTSKRMRDIALPFIFRSRRLELKISTIEFSRIIQNTPIDSPQFFKAYQEYATTARQSYLDDAVFLLSRGDLTQRLHHLVLFNVWHPKSFDIEYTVGGHMPTIQDPSFFHPVHERNLSILGQAIQIIHLEVIGFELTKDYLFSMQSSPSLHSLTFSYVLNPRTNLGRTATRQI